MKQIVNIADGGTEVLKIQESTKPTPQSSEILIRIRAAGLNFADIQARKGQYADAPSKPCVMGYEVSGTVDEVGEGVDKEWKGRPVVAMTRFKGQAEYVVVSTDQVFEKPDLLTFEEAAAIPVNYLTAYVLTEVMGGLKSYESILVHNAGGGVGLAAVDISRHIGAKIFGTASSHKHEILKSRGIDEVVDYNNHDWLDWIRSKTNQQGVELVIDPLGGRHWKKSYRALRATGRLGMFGVSSASKRNTGRWKAKWDLLKTVLKMPFFHPIPLTNKNNGVFGVNLGHLWHETGKARQWINTIKEGIDDGWVRPRVDQTFPFSKVQEAHRYIEDRRNIGKVVLIPDYE